MTYDRTDRIRRAAILVASLDEPLAEQLLAELPPAVATRVLDAAERLEEIDAEEQQDVLAEFRRLKQRSGQDHGAVEFESRSEEAAFGASRGSESAAGGGLGAPENDGLSDGDAAAMAELLAREHPQIVAAALSRLSEAQSAAVFAALPAELQAETLERLSMLAPADEEAVLDVTNQLQHRLQQQRERQARAAAGAELVQKILSRTAPAQRTYLLERLSARNEQTIAAEETRRAAAPRQSTTDPVAQQAFELAAALRRAPLAATPAPAEPAEPAAPRDLSAELEQLDDESLVAALRASDEATVLRALAASGDVFLGRVTNMLPRRQAKALRRMLRDLGPTRLADLHRAQHELLRRAQEFAETSAAA